MSLQTPDKIQSLQRKLYLKAKAEPDFRFYLREDVQAGTGAAGADPEAWGQRRTTARHPDVAGIMHLTPHGFGEMGIDVLNWQPKFKELGRICRQSISRIVRLACAGAQRQDHGRSNSKPPKG